MNLPIEKLISKSDIEILKLNHATSTLHQYRWAWQRFAEFGASTGYTEFTDELLTDYMTFISTEFESAQLKPWKYKLLRKSALVLSEVQKTGTYRWKLSRHTVPNDALNDVFRPIQEQFETWLSLQGIAQRTQELRATIARSALASWQQEGIRGPQELTGREVGSAVVSISKSYGPSSMGTVLVVIRVLCRFLEETQGCSSLLRAVPSNASRRVRHVSVLSGEQIQVLTNAPAPGTVSGSRDRAMLLLGASTGLRPVDIVALRLQDIDWPRGCITLTQQKTGTLLRLPLLADVGEAIADYLLCERPPAGADEHVFLRSQAPYVGLAPSNRLHYLLAGAFARSGIRPQPDSGKGFGVLRSSFATRMLEAGTPLTVISAALGHRGISSAKHYLSADEQRMRECCLDFSGIEPTGLES